MEKLRGQQYNMNVYDFDGTVYHGDSSVDFWAFCIKRHPSLVKTIPQVFVSGVKYKFFHGDLEEFKSAFFCFLSLLPDVKNEVVAFWDKHENKIYGWYMRQRQDDDVIISASPEFLLQECCARLGAKLIGTRIDKRTGQLIGRNCKGEEKVRRFREIYPDGVIQSFYSDSHSDIPMAEQARQSFFIKSGKALPWNVYQTDNKRNSL